MHHLTIRDAILEAKQALASTRYAKASLYYHPNLDRWFIDIPDSNSFHDPMATEPDAVLLTTLTRSDADRLLALRNIGHFQRKVRTRARRHHAGRFIWDLRRLVHPADRGPITGELL